MQWPTVEQAQLRYDMRALYYDQDPEPVPGRVDIDSARLDYAETLLGVAEVGGDPADLRTTTLLWCAWQVGCELRISTTANRLDRLAVVDGRQFDAQYAHELAERAAEFLCGAALSSALRAIAWNSYCHDQLRGPRAALVAEARRHLDEAGACGGRAMLLADDAHAHLTVADRIRPANDDVVRTRSLFAQTGFLLLAASCAAALSEPWSPFSDYRLRHEFQEHAHAAAHLAEGDQAALYANAAHQAQEDRSGDPTAEYEAVMAEHPGEIGDIEAYWTVRERRRDDAAGAPAAPPVPARIANLLSELTAGEPGWRRFV